MAAVLRARTGATIALELGRWHAGSTPAEEALLASVAEPVLDIGCGPGRLAATLATKGRVALGIDPSPSAVAAARRRGACALRRDVFGPLPGERRWATALLLDGNIGIGGDPIALLTRVRQLLRPGGEVVVEVRPPGTRSERLVVRLDTGETGERGGSGEGGGGPWFGWAVLGADDFPSVARAAGLRPVDGPCAVVVEGDRWMGRAVNR
ncbi:class I SAM-dependent methyltransferase [soil metagenome]